MGVIVERTVWRKLDNLVTSLHSKKYFGTKVLSTNYVNQIIGFIYSIPDKRRYPTKNKKYGVWYCRFKPNRRTSWYTTFDTDETLWVIRNVFSNHDKGYPAFIRDL
jgi:hypothetical protein